jgi:hypothetical protein
MANPDRLAKLNEGLAAQSDSRAGQASCGFRAAQPPAKECSMNYPHLVRNLTRLQCNHASCELCPHSLLMSECTQELHHDQICCACYLGWWSVC